jgi:hypothetical protein
MECRTVKYVQVVSSAGEVLYGRIDDDGLMRLTCSHEDTAYLAWVAEGNIAEEWNPEEAE